MIAENNNYSTEGRGNAPTTPVPVPIPPETEYKEAKVLNFLYTYFEAAKDRILDDIEEETFRSLEGAHVLHLFKQHRGINNFQSIAEGLAALVVETDPSRGTYIDWLNRYAKDNSYTYGRELEECLADINIIARQVKEYNYKLQAAELYHLAMSGSISVEAIEGAEAAFKKMKESNADKYADLLEDPDEEAFYKLMGEAPTGIETSFEFSNDEGDVKKLIIPSGAVSIICAPTSHGKSTMLRNLALEMAREQTQNPGRVLYFTFEESEADLYAQMLNTYIGIDLHRPTKSHNNFKTIKEYFVERKKGNADKVLNFMGSNRATFLGHLSKFQKDYISSGRLKVINKNYDITQLVAAIKYYCKAVEATGQKVKAIFVDYIQLLSLADRKKLSRAEELKEVCIELKDYSVESHLPIVLAAQLNRETKSPLALFNQNISEASDIEKVANLIICIWNSRFEAQDQTYYGKTQNGGSKPNKDAIRLESKGFFAGGAKKYSDNASFNATPENKRSTLYARITKYRGETVGLDAVLQWNPNTGKILENCKETASAEQSLPFDPPTNKIDF